MPLPGALSKPSAFLVLDNFLGEELAGQMLRYAGERREDFRPAKVGGIKGRTDTDVRRAVDLHDLGPWTTELAAAFRGAIGPASTALGLAPFKLARQEMVLVCSGDGAFYQRHIDTMSDVELGVGYDRILTGVYYLHARPRRFSGGAIRLHSILPAEAGGSFIDVEPEHDRLVLFPSWMPHEVLPVSLPDGAFADSRFSINCWFRRAPIS